MWLTPAECVFIMRTGNYSRLSELVNEQGAAFNYKALHSVANTVLCLSSLLCNGLLLHVIKCRSGQLRDMKPILMFGCVFDLVLSVVSLQTGALPTSTMRVMSVLDNQLIPFRNAALVRALKLISGTCTFVNWWITSLQFVWRYYVLTRGKSPSLPCRFLATLVCTLIVTCIGLTVFNMHVSVSEAERTVLVDVIRYNGFRVASAEEVSGAFVDQERCRLYSMMILVSAAQLYIVGGVLDLGLSVHFRHHKEMSARTARLIKGVRNVFRFMAVGPFLTSTLPALVVTREDRDCAPRPIFTMVTALLSISQTLIRAGTTLYFVEPYRVFVRGKLGGKRESALRVVSTSRWTSR